MRVHYKQWLISDGIYPVYDDWENIKIGPRKYLSYCPSLEIEEIFSKIRKWILLGYATDTCGINRTIGEQLANITTVEELLDKAKHWGGRWIIISDDIIISDAGNMMGIFYTANRNDLSGSISLLREIFFPENELLFDLDFNPRAAGIGVNWYVSPNTGIKDIFKIQINEYLIIKNNPKRYEVRFIEIDDSTALTDGDLITEIKDHLMWEVKYIQKYFKGSRYLALTGGFDSRLLFSFFQYLKFDVTTYTQLYPSIPRYDAKIPKYLSNNEHHIFKRRQSFSVDRLNMYDKHLLKHAKDRDREFFAYNQWSDFPENSYAYRGGVVNFFRWSFYHKIFPTIRVGKSNYLSLEKGLGIQNNVQSRYLRKWYEYIRERKLDKFYLQDIFYYYQQIGTWYTYIEQSISLAGVRSLHLGNTRRLFNLALLLTDKTKKMNEVHKSIMKELFPEALLMSFNKENLLDKIVRNIYTRYDRYYISALNPRPL